MKKRNILVLVLVLITGCWFSFQKKSEENTSLDLLWFTLENISYDVNERRITGNCIDGTYIGEMEVYLSNTIDDSCLEDGQTIRVLGGPGMTMSLPPQLMNCKKVEVLENGN